MMNELRGMLKRLEAEGMKATAFCRLLMLKMWNDEFEKERQEIRADFLVRGICDREVDGLLDDPGLYQCVYLPSVLRWDTVKRTIKDGNGDFVKFTSVLHQLITREFPEWNGQLPTEEWMKIPYSAISSTIDLLDHHSIAVKQPSAFQFIKEQLRA